MTLRAAWCLVTKAERAKLHLDAFNRHVSAYMKEPYTIVSKYDAENRRHIKRFQLKGFESVLGMELGEFLYSLRSGLDQMAWQMAKPRARQTSPRDIYFPITISFNFTPSSSPWASDMSGRIKLEKRRTVTASHLSRNMVPQLV